jgi:hypothetical protein
VNRSPSTRPGIGHGLKHVLGHALKHGLSAKQGDGGPHIHATPTSTKLSDVGYSLGHSLWHGRASRLHGLEHGLLAKQGDGDGLEIVSMMMVTASRLGLWHGL